MVNIQALAATTAVLLLGAGSLGAQVAAPVGIVGPPSDARSAFAGHPGAEQRTMRPDAGRVALTTLFTSALGGGGGLLVASVKCGRTPTCTPTSYPYPLIGSVVGSWVGATVTGQAAGCKSAGTRSAIGTALGMLVGGALLSQVNDGAHMRPAAGVGAAVGASVLVARCSTGKRVTRPGGASAVTG